jgi:hypothetical protein
VRVKKKLSNLTHPTADGWEKTTGSSVHWYNCSK